MQFEIYLNRYQFKYIKMIGKVFQPKIKYKTFFTVLDKELNQVPFKCI